MGGKSQTTNIHTGPATERIDARVSKETKEILERAAALDDVSLSAFVIGSAVRHARQVVAEHAQWKLSRADSRAFVDAILNPPEPNKALKAAAARHKGLQMADPTSGTATRTPTKAETAATLDRESRDRAGMQGRATHGTPELDEDARKLAALGADPGPAFVKEEPFLLCWHGCLHEGVECTYPDCLSEEP